MQEKYNWNLEEIFKSENEFSVAQNELNDNLQKIKEYQGKLNSAINLYECYHLYEKSLELYEKIYAYGTLKYHLDMADSNNIKLYKKVEDIRNRV